MSKPLISPVFVGRERESARLDALLDQAVEGEPGAVLIGGEAGIGKTRLLDEFLRRAEGRGAVTVVGSCLELGADGLPWAPFVSAFRALHQRLGPELAAAARGNEEQLARLLPELGPVIGRGDDDAGRLRLYELTRQLLERLSAERPLVVALEDLHWSDRSTRELLLYLLRSLTAGRILLVGTYRADDLHRRHPLRGYLAELDRLRGVGRLELDRLTRDEVARQLTGILGVEPAPAVVDEVHRRSDGNAFFVEELSCALERPDVADGSCAPTAWITASLRDLLLVRVEELPENAQQVVRVLAEAWSQISHQLLAAVVDMPEDDLLEALRAATEANVLLPSRDGHGYRFRHSLVREAVSDDLLPGERTLLNRRLAQVLEERPHLVRPDELPARLAGYWYHAHEPVKALPATLEAARVAGRRYAYAEQLRLLERALDLWESVPEEIRDTLGPVGRPSAFPPCGCTTEHVRYLDVLAQAVVAARLALERERGLRLVKQALRMLDGERDPERTAWFLVQRFRLIRYSAPGRQTGCEDLLTAHDMLRGRPPSAVQADVLTRLAAWEMLTWAREESAEMARQAVSIAVAVGEKSVELNARITLGTLEGYYGRTEAAIAEMRRAVDLSRVWEEPDLLTRSYLNLSHALEAAGRSAESVEAAREGMAAANRYGLARDSGAWLAGNLADSLMSLGEWDEAERVVSEALEILGTAHGERQLTARLGQLALDRGELEIAAERLRAVRDEYDASFRAAYGTIGYRGPSAQPQFLVPQGTLEVGLRAAQGRYAEAREAALELLRPGVPDGQENYLWPLLIAAAAAEADGRAVPAMAAGRDEAVQRLRWAAAQLPRHAPVWEASARLLDALLARVEGRVDRAAAIEAARAFTRWSWPLPAARAALLAAEACLAEGDRAEAARWLADAHAGAERLGARPLLARVRELAEAAGLASATRPATVPAPRAGGPSTGPADAARPAPNGTAGTPPATRPAGTRAVDAGGAAGGGTAVATGTALGLTRRELDVLRLVAQGRSNGQIAGELYISPKTVSVHVSRILAKLGVSSRGEAAALAHRERLFATTPH
ncbi:helix-turn-helix transcriptional regulator [Allostreptomyces psammosilenae]|uniref:DNA-binding CsgD family transcriptional regulator/tetratricopeptide (TPR) repeat protein n=1 Tax=Allostreptomyces psammosilenae TaxID=1892865 RepID=A0A852ZVZ0_9ACTN|nr:AAA family ATPase [Allostreptomyces psammosilenae]NYI06546.1 DNA-binding CsgD family transcriptional regulator/tetratricopeptide (TPR) repeat protein [Allostreptomyces psammosilenae]